MKSEYIETGRTNQKLETRSKILASAQYFLNQGQKFGMEDVAKKTGVSRATIYRYYSNIEILSAEAGLDISTKSPETIHEELEGKTLCEKILGVQDYFNVLAIDHENAFRKYLSTVIVSDAPEMKRGARRKKSLELILKNTQLSSNEKKDMVNLLTILMGIEPLIITKDVLDLDNNSSSELLTWGMELLLKGLGVSKND